MKRETFWALGGLAASAAAALGITLYQKKKKQSKPEIPDLMDEVIEPEETPDEMIHVDYKDEDHLIFCEETDLERRMIQLEHTINMRDIGGYTGLNGRKTRWGKVIRSEELNILTDADLAYLESIGLKHIYDFRDEKKANLTPDRIPHGTEYHNIPALTGMPMRPSDMGWEGYDPVGEFFHVVYSFQVKEKAQIFAEVLKTLGKDETPLLVHCSNGKDRTGIMIAFILLICGVPEETIISDYTLTNLNYDTACARFTPHMVEEYGCDPDRIRDFFGVRPEWLKIMLDYIKNNYASADDYFLKESDLTQADLDAVRAVMLEPEITEV